MSETIHHNHHERHAPAETHNDHRSQELLAEKLQHAAKVEREHNAQHQIEQLHHAAKKEAVSGKEHHVHGEKEPATGHTYITRELKDSAYQRNMSRIRRRLPAYQKMFSSVIHQPVIDSISEVSSKTVARPSGLLGGGLMALLGTSAYFYITKHFGYTYNTSWYLMFLLGGFIIGLAMEFIWHYIKPQSQ